MLREWPLLWVCIQLLCVYYAAAETCSIRIERPAAATDAVMLNLAEVKLYDRNGTQYPTSKLQIAQSSVVYGQYPVQQCFDGIGWTYCCTNTEKNAWLSVAYNCSSGLSRVDVVNELNCCWDRINSFVMNFYNEQHQLSYPSYHFTGSKMFYSIPVDTSATPFAPPDYCSVRIERPADATDAVMLNLAEVELYDENNSKIRAGSLYAEISSTYSSSYPIRNCFDGSNTTVCTTHALNNTWMRIYYDCALRLSRVDVYNEPNWGMDHINSFVLNVYDSAESVTQPAFNFTGSSFFYRIPVVASSCHGLPLSNTLVNTSWPSYCGSGQVAVGALCRAACPQGQHGSYTSECLAAGAWGPVVSSCIPDTCDSPPTRVAPDNSLGWPETCINSSLGFKCVTPCDSQFGEGYWSVCNAMNEWTPVNGSCPVACSAPPTPSAPSGSKGWGSSCINGTVAGSKCMAWCAKGYKGSITSTCIGKDQWSEPTGSCEPVCKRIHRGCQTCRAERQEGSRQSTMVCSACFAGWRLRMDGTSSVCDCAPGFTFNGTSSSGWCTSCPKGLYCPGGAVDNPDSQAYNCSVGLQTITEGAKSEQQCFTAPGYGRTSKLVGRKVVISVNICPNGTYNGGGNTAGCIKCGPGLTTTAPGADSVIQCVAPAGLFVDRGTSAKLCPKGTYTADYNSLPACLTCPDGLTTSREGSNSTSACRLAKVGYYLVNATAAELCPSGSYQGSEAEVYKCDACPYGYVTKDIGATGEAECLAPPGFALKINDTLISKCDLGYYKEGWSKNPCLPCGAGLTTAATGSVSKDACLVPAGYGLISVEPPIAVKCTNNSYGANATRAVAADARCTFCEPNLYTSDTLSGGPASMGYTAETDCLVKPGWGLSASGAEACRIGTYNPGINRQQCKPCETGFTTLEAGGDSKDACVVQPGWELDNKRNIPQPCNAGSWSAGGTLQNHGGSCQPCPQGFTTQKDEATSAADCDVCLPGHGGLNCTLCPHNTFSASNVKQDPCTPCAQGMASARGSIDSSQCIAELVDAGNDYFPLSDDSRWTDSNTTDAVACQYACNIQKMCAMYRISVDPHMPTCQLLLENPDGRKTLGFKADATGMAYALYKMEESLEVGVMLSDEALKTPLDCMKACNNVNGCELISLDTAALPAAEGPCKLYASALDAVWIGMYHIQGDRLYADMLSTE